MSMFENNQYRWRETCFVLFQSSKHPALKTIEKTLARLDPSYQLQNAHADDQGRFDSLTLLSPDDFAAMDICYTCGVEILEQGAALAEELESAACDVEGDVPSERIRQADARFDVLHFEKISDGPDEGEFDEVLDPGALLIVLNALAKLTDGIAVDPQTGTVLSDDI
ncbi:MAG: hypothetical protein V3R99_08130 [Thermoguttaceae bacterium]